MLTKSDAQLLVDGELSNVDFPPGLQILDGSTLEYSWGWVFFYQSKEFLKTEDFRDQIAGNTPYIVNKYTGEVRATGTAHDIDYYVEKYETEIGQK